ncbi:hypothetical protein Tsubulata_019165 [Turnera subulata]|uniref:Pentacotripeptide-repeat region of PRORP domain-containing protein n=1 Tax=Turnera subulata TaxID=218843 RepID=A0A9Q0GFJ1_9ROSI|nr:hypothetical protein Tsubulata_019165 [Turnera subulata]
MGNQRAELFCQWKFALLALLSLSTMNTGNRFADGAYEFEFDSSWFELLVDGVRLNVSVVMSIRWPRFLTPTQLSQILGSQKNPFTALKIFQEAKEKYPNYQHNGPVYATMIGFLGKTGHVAEMKEVVEQMREDSCECKDSVFVTAIKTYAKAGQLNEAVSLFKSISQFNCVNWTESFNTLLQIMVEESKFEAAHRLFLENSFGWEVKSRIRSLNLLLAALCQRNRSDLALQVFQEMNYQGCYPDRDSYRILMRGLCEDRRLNEAIHLLYSMFWRISQKGSGEDIVIYRILLDALCDNGHAKEALEILGKILKKGLKAPNRFRRLDLSRFDNGEDMEATKRMINETLISGGIPNSASYATMAIDLYNEGKIDQADKVLNETIDRGFRPSLPTYEAKLAALCKAGRLDEAVNVIEVELAKGYCIPSVKMYNVLMRGLCDVGNSTLSVSYLKKMAKQVGCVPNEETYSILVHGLCQDGDYVKASRLLEEMLIRSHWPPIETYNKLIHGLCSIGRQYEAVMWLEEMISQGKVPESSVWKSLVTSVCCDRTGIDVPRETLEMLLIANVDSTN